MEELGAFKNHNPYALGIWLRMSDEYQALGFEDQPNSHGLYCALLNSRILLSTINALCELNMLAVNKDLHRISLSLRPKAAVTTSKSWAKWGADTGKELHARMADLEAQLCDMIDDPFWQGEASELSHSGLWALDVLANLDVSVDGKAFDFRPLIMLDDVHELSDNQLEYLFKLLMSRQVPLPFWVSLRKQALGLENLLTERIGRGVEKGRDYQIIDLEKSSRGQFKNRVLEISKLRVQSVRHQIGGLYEAFVDFISDERREILDSLDENVAQQIRDKILSAAGPDLQRFEARIGEIESQCAEPHELCQRLRMLEILVQREMGRRQRSFGFNEVSSEALRKHESNIAAIEAAELFLATERKFPYYFGPRRLIALASSNIQQFLKLAGALFEEIMTAIRLGREGESVISPERQQAILKKAATDYLKEIPVMARYGNQVVRLVNAIGEMCKKETYRPTAPYAPGVTGTALTMYEVDILVKKARRGDRDFLQLYETIQSAIAHNILEPVHNYRCKGQRLLVLYLNRLLCVEFQLPLQKGGFREKSLSTFHKWVMPKRKDSDQRDLWG